MINLFGEHNCKVDAKGRVMFPSALKKQLTPVLQKGFVLKQSIFNSCLELYPMDEWDEALVDVKSKNRFIKKNNDFRRVFFAGVKLIELDGTGRFLISKNLCDYAGIKKEIVISAIGGIMEIWDKEAYQIEIAKAAKNLPKLTEEVMGDEKLNEDE